MPDSSRKKKKKAPAAAPINRRRRPAAATAAATATATSSGGGGGGFPSRAAAAAAAAAAKGKGKGNSNSKSKSKSKEEAVRNKQNLGIAIGVLVCLFGCFLMLMPAPSATGGPGGGGMDGPNAPRPLPQAPVPTFHTPSIDATRRAAAAPSDSELAAADDAHDAAVDDSSGDEAQTPAQRAAARKARKAAKKKDLRSAGFGSPGAESEDPSASGLTLADDPRFRQAAKTADLRQQAQFADMWSPAAACQNGVLDAECPAVHRHLHAEVPDAITFECSASTDCHGYPCVQGQCVCGGLAVGTDCGSRRLLHFEWAQPGAVAKSSAEQRSGVPSLATFRRLLRGTSPHDALEEVIRAFSLVQDPQQSELDAKVQAKLKPELEFLLRAAAETSPDGALDLTSLAEEALHTSLQTMIWMCVNCMLAPERSESPLHE